MRATTTAAEAMPCCADGTTLRLADVSGPITRPSPEACDHQFGAAREAVKGRVVVLGQQVVPLRDHHVAAGGDQQPDEGHRAVADPGRDEAAHHAPIGSAARNHSSTMAA